MGPERRAFREACRYEARRLAAAFAIDSFKPLYPQTVEHWVGHLGGARVHYRLNRYTGKMESVDIVYLGSLVGMKRGKERRLSCSCHVYYNDAMWKIVSPDGKFEALMARGLYCLGFEDKRVMGILPTLSMHDKVECHQRLPREFWPEAWFREFAPDAM